ncbi:MAG: alpha/beta hydrolase-fold protein [Bacteroidota bacterium]
MSSFRTIELSDSLYEQDGLRFLTVKTPHLKGRADICLYVPKLDQPLTNLPIYILLHGVYGSAWIWALKGGAHHTAHEMIKEGKIKPAIIAMPSDGLWGDGSAYFSHHDYNYDQWIVNDVPLAIKENIAEAGAQSSICIGGLSMGGYGALMLGARFPDTFKAVSGHSSITQLQQMSLFVEEPLEEYQRFAQDKNVIDIMRKNKESLPQLRFDCGVQDELLETNRLLHQQLSDLQIPHHYEEFEGGHEWPYWREHVKKTFRFFNQHS